MTFYIVVEYLPSRAKIFMPHLLNVTFSVQAFPTTCTSLDSCQLHACNGIHDISHGINY